MVLILFSLCWVIFFCTCLGRLNYSSAMAEMISKKILTRPRAGLINTLFFSSMLWGQLINGYIGDRISSKRMIFIYLLCVKSHRRAQGLKDL